MPFKFIESILDWIYPPKCMICQNLLVVNGPRWFCEDCKDILRPIEPPFCPKCGQPAEETGEEKEAEICGDCRRRARRFEKNTAVFLYDDVMRNLIHQFKYGDHPTYGYGFAEQMARYLGADVWKGIDQLIPVPLHPKRFRKRGYNQAQILAEGLSKRIGIPVETDLLLRVKNTKPQSALGPDERENNIKDAFQVRKEINAKSFLIIDDIYTTGETLSACSTVLLESGAARVCGLTLAIAQRENKKKG